MLRDDSACNLVSDQILGFDSTAAEDLAAFQKARKCVHWWFQCIWHEFDLQRVKSLFRESRNEM